MIRGGIFSPDAHAATTTVDVTPRIERKRDTFQFEKQYKSETRAKNWVLALATSYGFCNILTDLFLQTPAGTPLCLSSRSQSFLLALSAPPSHPHSTPALLFESCGLHRTEKEEMQSEMKVE